MAPPAFAPIVTFKSVRPAKFKAEQLGQLWIAPPPEKVVAELPSNVTLASDTFEAAEVSPPPVLLVLLLNVVLLTLRLPLANVPPPPKSALFPEIVLRSTVRLPWE